MEALSERPLDSAFATPSDYWHQSQRPLTSLLFILPLLVAYEVGAIWFGPEMIRNGADVWLQQLLGALGIGGFLLLPFTIVAILLAWHHVSREPWRVSPVVLYTMAAECTLFGMLLVLVAHVHASTLSLENFRLTSEIVQATDARVVCGRVVRYFGAGIYEELLFRLILVPIAMAVVGLAIAPRRPKIIVVLVVTSALFSLAHYVGPHGEDFAVYTFVFRFIAGGIFALLFIFRGFGIAVGTHALYDIFVGL